MLWPSAAIMVKAGGDVEAAMNDHGESRHDATDDFDDGARPDWIDSLRMATGFLTRLPVAWPQGRYRLARAAGAFPLVGALVGLLSGLTFLLGWWIGLGAWLAATAAIATGILVTGALHEDGLADVADGFGARGAREERLAAMRDSRTGAYGVVALVLSLAARIGAVATLHEPVTALLALVAAGALSRAAMVVAMRYLPAARQDGLGAGAGTPDTEEMIAALAVAGVLAVAMLLPWGWAAAIVFAGLGAGVTGWRASRAFGGQTGDVLGAIQQVAEIGVLAAAVAMA